MIDMHTHILPHMDDGCRSVETSIELLRRLAAQGVDTVCLTSHYYAWHESVASFCERRQKSCQYLLEKTSPGDEKIPKLLRGAEVAFFPGIQECGQLDALCIEGTKTLMLEMPFAEWNRRQSEAVMTLVLDRGYCVVLVHPERFCFHRTNEKYLTSFLEMPIAFQVNADTLIHWRTRKRGLDFLRQTRIPLLGSDCHNLDKRPPHMKGAADIIRKKLGEDFFRHMEEEAVRLTFPGDGK